MFVHMLCALVSGSSAFKRRTALPRRWSRFTQPLLEQLETRVNPGLVAPLAFDAGSFPQSVAVGDFNGDGVLDLAVANYGSNTVSVLLGAGDGGFGAARNFGVGINPVSVAVGDFNGDGVLDLAVANFFTNTVSVLLGTGDGGFGAARNFGVGRGPVSVATGDFNGDGVLDLAVANASSNAVSVLLGTGDGGFAAARDFGPVSAPRSVAVGDFNGDGVLDLVVAAGTVRVLLGTGDGTFRPFPAGHVSYSAAGAVAVAVGDFDGDGWLDAATANISSDDVSVLLNDGIWNWDSPGGSPHGGATHGHAAASHPRPSPLHADAGLREWRPTVPTPIIAASMTLPPDHRTANESPSLPPPIDNGSAAESSRSTESSPPLLPLSWPLLPNDVLSRRDTDGSIWFGPIRL